MVTQKTYSIHEVAPYINWSYFYHAWSVGRGARSELRRDAENLLVELDRKYHTYATYGLFEANSEDDDIVVERGVRSEERGVGSVERGVRSEERGVRSGERGVGSEERGVGSEERGVRIPMLRQQHPSHEGEPCLCLADFLRPCSSGQPDRIGIFAATVDAAMESEYHADDYMALLAQTLADRLAEATVECLHEDIRKHVWGYAPDENLSVEQLHREAFQGIRPAVGYPSLPDTSVNFLLYHLIAMPSIGIRLTENGMMQPHASVSGLMFAHPAARYFNLGKIGHDQLADYAHRRGLPIEVMRRFLASNLLEQ